ncbi:MAG: amidohydrolase, partial [Lysinibacillus sp.]|nr:amidohydrolase [Lysinibacillus sp.]
IECGIEVETGYATSGVIGVLKGGKEGPVIGLRADMDGLPIKECTGVDFASEHENVMHACGHDMHVSMLLGAAKVLSKMREDISGTIKFIFQPAEEMLAGARVMIKDGALKNPDVDYIYGFHVWPDLPLGKIGFKSGALMASMDQFEVTLTGKSGHGAAPHQGVDAIVGSANIIASLQSIISREIDPLDSAVITIGTLEAGTGFNIIPEKAVFKGTVRTINSDTRKNVQEKFTRIVQDMGSAFRLDADIRYIVDYPVTSNVSEYVDHAKGLAKEVFGSDAVEEIEKPSMASEDFAFYLEEVPGAFLFLGVGDDEGGAYKLHHEKFLPSPEAMKYGIGLYVALATTPFIKK